MGVDLGLSELVEVAEELEHVRAAAARELQRWAVVAQSRRFCDSYRLGRGASPPGLSAAATPPPPCMSTCCLRSATSSTASVK
nr:unnamed protein product [Digitaria exilis]